MTRFARLLTAAAILAGLIAAPAAAHADPIAWDRPDVTIVDATPDGALQALANEELWRWNQAHADQFAFATTVVWRPSPTCDAHAGEVWLCWDDMGGYGAHHPDVSAAGWTDLYADDGGIHAARIYLCRCYDADNLRVLVGHELGHAAGLEHTDRPGSLMIAGLSPDRSPDAGDLEALRDLYALRWLAP